MSDRDWSSEMMDDDDDFEDEVWRQETVNLQARVINQQLRDIANVITNISAGEQQSRRVRNVQAELLGHMLDIIYSGALAAPLLEPVGVEHLRLIQFYNSVVLRRDWMRRLESLSETEEESEADSESDQDTSMDGDASLVEEVQEEQESEIKDSVIIIESSEEEFESEDEAEARFQEF